MTDIDDDVIVLDEEQRTQLRHIATTLAPLVRPDSPKTADRLGRAHDLTDESLIYHMTIGWGYAYPRLEAAFNVIRETAQHVFSVYQRVFEQFLENTDYQALQAAVEEEGGRCLRDLYGIEDEIEEIADWEPGGDEFPAVLPEGDETWLAKRFLAIRYSQEEATETEAMFARQIEVLMAEIHRLEERRDEQTGKLRRSIRRITGQLVNYHRASISRAEREHAAKALAAFNAGREAPKQRLPTTIKGVHGDLRSRAGGNVLVRIEPGKEAAVVEWLDAGTFRHGDPGKTGRR